jgi:hypothetical protein
MSLQKVSNYACYSALYSEIALVNPCFCQGPQRVWACRSSKLFLTGWGYRTVDPGQQQLDWARVLQPWLSRVTIRRAGPCRPSYDPQTSPTCVLPTDVADGMSSPFVPNELTPPSLTAQVHENSLSKIYCLSESGSLESTFASILSRNSFSNLAPSNSAFRRFSCRCFSARLAYFAYCP